jgi:hypothetical protein
MFSRLLQLILALLNHWLYPLDELLILCVQTNTKTERMVDPIGLGSQ